MRMNWPHSDRFPPDPNVPPSPSERLPRPRLAIEAPVPAARDAALLGRELAQLRLIGPAAGAQLRRIVYGDGEQAGARLPTTASPRQAPTGPRRR
jgi:hypothetical protein